MIAQKSGTDLSFRALFTVIDSLTCGHRPQWVESSRSRPGGISSAARARCQLLHRVDHGIGPVELNIMAGSWH